MPEFSPGDPPENAPHQGHPSVPVDWKTSVFDLISARSQLIHLELAEFRRRSTRRAALLILAVLAAASGWLLFLAGMAPLLANAFGISWPVMALILAGIHAIFVGVCLTIACRNTGPAFSATLSEFHKDREWIENLHKTPKS